MSSFGGIAVDMEKLDIDFLVSSANKCIEGVPGFGFILAKKSAIQETKGQARSLSLDLYGQWKTMDADNGKWRFTSPPHVTRAFHQAMKELEAEGGIEKRAARYRENHRILVAGMRRLGFKAFLSDEDQSPIITSFYSPKAEKYNFEQFYEKLKSKGFVIYPGKVTNVDSFRIGNIGHVFPEDMSRLVKAVEDVIFW